MTDCATLQTWLLEAELALHKLQTGTAEQTITFGSGKSVVYNIANLDKLKAYVADLQNQVATCNGRAPCKRGPIRFAF